MLRGYVQHVASREIIYFADWDKLVAFMNNHLTDRNSGPFELEQVSLRNNLEGAEQD